MKKFDFDGTTVESMNDVKKLILINTVNSFPTIYARQMDTDQLNSDTSLRAGGVRMLATEIRTHSPTEEESQFADQLTDFANEYRTYQAKDDSLEQRDHVADSVEEASWQIAQGLVHHTINQRYVSTLKKHHRKQFTPNC